MCPASLSGDLGSQKRAPDSIELESRMVVSLLVGSGN